MPPLQWVRFSLEARVTARYLSTGFSSPRPPQALLQPSHQNAAYSSTTSPTPINQHTLESVDPSGLLPGQNQNVSRSVPLTGRDIVGLGRLPVPGRQVAPIAPPPSDAQLEMLHDFIDRSRRLVVLTGAGISTESGIPDYRSPQGAYSTGFKPMTHQEFVRSEKSRKRYWARSYTGWRRFVGARPGASHLALSRLEALGRIAGGMLTQNVDRLHHMAGSAPLELHGTTHVVECLNCGDLTDRHAFQERICNLNPKWAADVEVLERGEVGSSASFGMRQRPDGDIEMGEEFWQRSDFVVPPCLACSGTLKPHVVFFGDNVPRERVEAAQAAVAGGDALLVVGSSLMVLSAFRLARAATEAGLPLCLLNIGPTRADNLATLKIETRCGEILTRLLTMGSMDIPVT